MNKDQSNGNLRDTNGKGKRAKSQIEDDSNDEYSGDFDSKRGSGKSQMRAGSAKRDSGKSKNVNSQSSGRS